MFAREKEGVCVLVYKILATKRINENNNNGTEDIINAILVEEVHTRWA